MKKHIISLSILSIIILGGCAKFLEENVKSDYSGKNFFENETQVRLAIFGCYEPLRTITSANQFMGVVGTDEARIYGASVNVRDVVYDIWELDGSSDRLVNLWRALYKGINSVNTIVNGINNSILSDSLKNLYVGEARFLRGYYYYWLARTWGSVPLKLDPTLSYETAFSQKASVDEIFDICLRDFEAAEVLPLKHTAYIGRVTGGAARAMKAAVLLSKTGWPVNHNTQADYQEVIDACYDVMAHGGYSLMENYCDNFIMKNCDESIFEFQGGFVPGTGVPVRHYMGVVSTNPVNTNATNNPTRQINHPWVGSAIIRPHYPFAQSFSSGDKRKEYALSYYRVRAIGKNGYFYTDSNEETALPNMTGTGLDFGNQTNTGSDNGFNNEWIGIAKFRYPSSWNKDNPTSGNKDQFKNLACQWDMTKFSSTDNPSNWTFMRYAEIYLIMAEAQYMVNGYDSCRKYLLPLAARADVTVWDGISDGGYSNPRDIITERILKERSWELCFEGHRFFDLQRMNKLYEHIYYRDRNYAGVVYANWKNANSITVDTHYYPVPFAELFFGDPSLGLENGEEE